MFDTLILPEYFCLHSANILTELDIAMLYFQYDNNVNGLKQFVVVKFVFFFQFSLNYLQHLIRHYFSRISHENYFSQRDSDLTTILVHFETIQISLSLYPGEPSPLIKVEGSKEVDIRERKKKQLKQDRGREGGWKGLERGRSKEVTRNGFLGNVENYGDRQEGVLLHDERN